MPLIGIVDPSHDEYANNEPGRYPKWYPVDELLGTLANVSPKFSPWTYELVAAVLGEQQERDYYSTSLLTAACPRAAVLERKEDYIARLDEMWAAVRGTLIHRTLEGAVRPGALAEWRFWTSVGGLEMSCSPDLVTADTLWDYKVTENPPTFGYPWKSHTLQLQFNRYIVNHAERWQGPNGETDIPLNPRTIQFGHLAIVYLGPKGPKVIECQATKDTTSPNGRAIRRKMPDIWDDEKVLTEMDRRLDMVSTALESYPTWPSGLEAEWGGPPGWACPGRPVCNLPNCLAKRYPHGLTWKSPA